MTQTTTTAPGKIILFGEHAVVYGQPAIAAPLSQVRATAIIKDTNQSGIHFDAPDLGKSFKLSDVPQDNPFRATVEIFQNAATALRPSPQPLAPSLHITITSQIPIAAGLGSGAAIAAAMLRGLAQHFDLPEFATDEKVCELTYEVERLHHGTPSGIDNTVVAYEKPIVFTRAEPHNIIEPFTVGAPLHLLVADTGVVSKTIEVVSDVRRQWETDRATFAELFADCGTIAHLAKRTISDGDIERVGQLMNLNHTILQRMTVSNDALDTLVTTAQSAGALGAKLSGAGRGGNMIVLVEEGEKDEMIRVLQKSGAVNILETTLL